MNLAQLFPEPRNDAARWLKELAQRHNELKAEARGLHGQAAADGAARTEATGRLHAAQAREHAFADAGPAVRAAQRELARIEKRIAECADTLRIVSDAAATVDGEIKLYAREHATELWAGMQEANAEVAHRLAAAVTEFAAAYAEQAHAGARATELLRLTDPERLRTERIPDPPAAVMEFARHAAQVAGSIPLPLPSAPGGSGAPRVAKPGPETSDGTDLCVPARGGVRR